MMHLERQAKRGLPNRPERNFSEFAPDSRWHTKQKTSTAKPATMRSESRAATRAIAQVTSPAAGRPVNAAGTIDRLPSALRFRFGHRALGYSQPSLSKSAKFFLKSDHPPAPG